MRNQFYNEYLSKRTELKIFTALYSPGGARRFKNIERDSKISPTSLDKHLKRMVENGSVQKDPRGGYILTERGRALLAGLKSDLRKYQKFSKEDMFEEEFVFDFPDSSGTTVRLKLWGRMPFATRPQVSLQVEKLKQDFSELMHSLQGCGVAGTTAIMSGIGPNYLPFE